MAYQPDCLPLTVVGGYLGAGKTTLLNRLLAEPDDQRIAVLVNDFGEVDIDGRLLESTTEDVLTLANGCVCCSIADDFATTLDTLRSFADRIDRVVVEVSGVGQPDKVAQWAHSPGFSPDGIVVVVDPLSIQDWAADRYVGDTVVAQVTCANLVVVSRTDAASPSSLKTAEAWLSRTTDATVLRSPVPAGLLLGPMPRRPRPTDGRHGSETDSRDQNHLSLGEPGPTHVTVSRWLDGPVSRSSLETWTKARPSGVVRAKGLIRVDDRPDERTVLQVCGPSTTVAVDGPWDDGEDVVVSIALPGTPRASLAKWLNLLR
ncbi:MAG: GTP-binding protein [Actinomycetota bacterium]|nr:GTP-binding protein [Actinomycetota bacterium]